MNQLTRGLRSFRKSHNYFDNWDVTAELNLKMMKTVSGKLKPRGWLMNMMYEAPDNMRRGIVSQSPGLFTYGGLPRLNLTEDEARLCFE